MSEAVQKLIEYLQQASPIFWQTIINQVYLEASFRLIWVVGLIVVCIVLAKIAQRLYKEEMEENDGYMKTWIVSIASGLSGITALIMLLSAIMWFINPYFYAIRWIIDSTIGGG